MGDRKKRSYLIRRRRWDDWIEFNNFMPDHLSPMDFVQQSAVYRQNRRLLSEKPISDSDEMKGLGFPGRLGDAPKKQLGEYQLAPHNN